MFVVAWLVKNVGVCQHKLGGWEINHESLLGAAKAACVRGTVRFEFYRLNRRQCSGTGISGWESTVFQGPRNRVLRHPRVGQQRLPLLWGSIFLAFSARVPTNTPHRAPAGRFDDALRPKSSIWRGTATPPRWCCIGNPKRWERVTIAARDTLAVRPTSPKRRRSPTGPQGPSRSYGF